MEAVEYLGNGYSWTFGVDWNPITCNCAYDNFTYFQFNEVSSTEVRDVFALIKLINSSVKKLTFPDCLKIANVLQIFKKREPSEINNYRPVSLLRYYWRINSPLRY